MNVFPDLLDPVLGTSFPRVDPAPSSMFTGDNEYDLHQLDDPQRCDRLPLSARSPA